jgi:hypothetical protein
MKSTDDFPGVEISDVISNHRDVEGVTHFQIMVIANPRSGNRKGQNLLNLYRDKPGHMEFQTGKTCDIAVYDVISQNKMIQDVLKIKIESKTQACLTLYR